MSTFLSVAVLLVATSMGVSAPPAYVSRIGGGAPPQVSAGPPGFSSLYKNAEAYTPGLRRAPSRGVPRSGSAGGFSGGRFGGATGYGRNGVRPPIPTPPTQLGGYRGFRR